MLSAIESYFSILMLFGASQAVTGIYLLLKKKRRPFSNNLLALLLFAWGFSCYWFFAFIHMGAFFSVGVTTFIGPMLALTLFPPVYLYVKYLFYEYAKFQRKDHLHFLPIYIYIGFTLFLYFDSDFSIAAMRKHEWFNARMLACSYIATLQGPFYFIKTRHILKLRRRRLEERYSEIENRKLEWFQLINYSFALVFIIGGVSTLFKIAFLDPYLLYMAYHAVIAVSLFYILIMIYKHPVLFTFVNGVVGSYLKSTSEIGNSDQKPSPKKIKQNETDKDSYDVHEVEIIRKIEKVMLEQKLYKNPNFSLNDLAEAISESRNAISHALNNGLNKSFYHYINELRIEESKRLLSDESLLHYAIDGIATESGFKTISVFYKFFKDIEKVTPAVYRKRAIEGKSLKTNDI